MIGYSQAKDEPSIYIREGVHQAIITTWFHENINYAFRGKIS